MPTTRLVASALYVLVGLALLGLGIRYLLASEIMPYHVAVISTPWSDLEAPQQRLLLGLLRGFGAGALCVGAVTLVGAWRGFRKDNPGPGMPTGAIALSYTALLGFVTASALNSGARPIAVSLTLFGMSVVAASLSVASRRMGLRPNPRHTT